MNDTPEKGGTSPLNFGGSSPFTSGQTEPLTDAVPETTTDADPVAEPTQEAPGTPANEERSVLDVGLNNLQDEASTQDQGEEPVTATTETEAAPVAEADASSAEQVTETVGTSDSQGDSPVATETQPEQVGEVTAPTIEQEESAQAGVPADLPNIASATDAEIDNAIKERDALNAKIEDGQKAQRQDVLAQIKKVVETYKIPLAELGEYLGIKGTRKGSKAKPKYRNPADGKEWSGRGKEPLWIKGKDRKDFLITA